MDMANEMRMKKKLQDCQQVKPQEISTLNVSEALTDCDIKVYGGLNSKARCPAGYKKVGLLGKGGCAVVWLGKNL